MINGSKLFKSFTPTLAYSNMVKYPSSSTGWAS